MQIATKALQTLADSVVFECKLKKYTLSCAESATGGFASHLITNVPGSSQVFVGGVVCYSAFAKQHALGVDFDIITEFGAISRETTKALLEGLKEKMGTDIGIAITGIAGSIPIEGKPRGLMYVGVSTLDLDPFIEECHFEGSRQEIKQQTAKKAFEMVLHHLERI